MTLTMGEKAKEIEQELSPKVQERISPSECWAPLTNLATIAYYVSTSAAERTAASMQKFNQSEAVRKLKSGQFAAYSAKVTIDVITSDKRFAHSYSGSDRPLNKDFFHAGYQRYTEGKFGDALTVLERPLQFIWMSIFSVPHNFHEGHGHIRLVQEQAYLMRAGIEMVRDVFYEISQQGNSLHEEANRGVLPPNLREIAENISTYFKDFKPTK